MKNTFRELLPRVSVNETTLDQIMAKGETGPYAFAPLNRPWVVMGAVINSSNQGGAINGGNVTGLLWEEKAFVASEEAVFPDELDIEPERAQRVEEVFARLRSVNHYELLGISRDAERKDIRKAYFDASKIFHPDTLFGKRLGHYKAKMEKIFHACTEAYEVLGKSKSREEYDAYLATLDGAVSARQLLTETANEARQAEQTGRVSVTPPAHRLRPEAKKQLQRFLAARVGKPGGDRRSTPPPEHNPLDSKQAAKNIARVLKSTQALSGIDRRAQEHMRSAEKAEKEGDVLGALNCMRLAISAAPQSPEVAAKYNEIRARLKNELLSNYRNQAAYEERVGKWDKAFETWSKACDLDPMDAAPHRRAAQALLHGNIRLQEAAKFAKKALELDASAQQHKVLGQIYVAAGMKASARAELQRALSLDPSDVSVKNLLAEL